MGALAATGVVLLALIHIAVAAPVAKPRLKPSDGTMLPPRMPISKGRDYFVDGRRGFDGGPGTLARPWRTINYALRRVPLSGSRVLVRGGTYVGQVEFKRSGNPTNPVTLRPYPGEHVLLTGPPGSLLHAVWIYGGGIRIRGFEVTAPTSNDDFRIENSHDVEIVGCDIHNAGHAGLLLVGTGTGGNQNIQVWSNRFHDNGGAWISQDPYWIRGDHAIYWGATSSDTDGIDHTAYGGVIANNLIYDQPFGRGVQIGSQVSGLIVTNNTIYRSYQPDYRAGNAIQLYGQDNNPYPPRDVLVVNNILADNAHYGVFGSGDNPLMQTNVVRDNLAWDNPDGNFQTTSSSTSSPLFQLGGGNITGRDPLFVDASNLDLRLQPGSPAIGKADARYAPPADFRGRLRSGAPDLGALEH